GCRARWSQGCITTFIRATTSRAFITYQTRPTPAATLSPLPYGLYPCAGRKIFPPCRSTRYSGGPTKTSCSSKHSKPMSGQSFQRRQLSRTNKGKSFIHSSSRRPCLDNSNFIHSSSRRPYLNNSNFIHRRPCLNNSNFIHSNSHRPGLNSSCFIH